ncbi:hypothetical protein C8J57DRAFT_1307400 [Mycena rebaudengoi]|nr:hypothetical protein C8J57DRAFT_1307400 [Mycena rebaudengoi]
MPGRGKKSTSSKKHPKQRDQTDGTGDREYENGAVRFCSMDDCFNYRNLKECARCRSAYYCSVECQRKNWQQHKPVCSYNVQLGRGGGDDPVLERHLRHWAVRFDATLLNACIRGLNLKYEWERIGLGGLVLFMEPRPHTNAGSRWRIQNAGMFQNEAIHNILEKLGMLDSYLEQVLPMHNEARKRLQESSGGNGDYVSVFMIAGNFGADALTGDHPPTFRFKPLDVHRPLVALVPMPQYDGDWLQDLKDQVHNDHPMKHVVPMEG